MNSGNGYPLRGAQGMFSTPMNSPRFVRAQSSPRFSPYNSSQGPEFSSRTRYSPVNAPQRYSPSNSSHNMYTSVNSPQDGYVPRHQFKGGYSPRNSSQNSSFGGYASTRSASPLHQQALRQSFNKSRESSGSSDRSSFNNSRNSSGSIGRSPFDNSRNSSGWSSRSSVGSPVDSRRHGPYDGNRNKKGQNSWNSNKSYRIEDYILPSMLEDPWANLKADRSKK